MKYQCGHEGCDVCGAAECCHYTLRRVLTAKGMCSICLSCERKAVLFAVEAVETFGGAIINPAARKCGEGSEG